MESVVDDDVSEPVIVNGQLGTAFRTATSPELRRGENLLQLLPPE